MNKPKVITFTALKGGTGKTIVTFNMAALLATEFNKNCLVLDIDPQHNMTNLLCNGSELGTENIFSNVYEDNMSLEKLVVNSHIPGLDIIPTSIKLTGSEVEIASIAGRELIIKNWLLDNEKGLSKYDYIFFDTNPTMSIININAFLASNSIVLVSDIDIDGINAVDTFLELYYPIQFRIDRSSSGNVHGLLINKVQNTTNMDKDFISFIMDPDFEYKDLLLETKLNDAVAVRETKLNRLPIERDRNKRSFKQFIGLIEELYEKEIF